MDSILIYLLKTFRKIYKKAFGVIPIAKPECEEQPDIVSELIYNRLIDEKPCMIARFGSTELTCICNYIGIKEHKYKFLSFVSGKTFLWVWDPKIILQMQEWSGFFPPEIIKIEQFCEMMVNDMTEVDILGSWQVNEIYMESQLVNVKKIMLLYLDPFWSKVPWTKALQGKNVLVVHPFAESIKKQYLKRDLLFKNKDVLPEFKSLTVIKAVQSLGQADDRFKDWFEALEYMKEEISKVEFDICLIGCGAYGFPLAAHVKRIGKKAVHMGGSLQLLFGIKGKRWESPIFGATELGVKNMYPQLMNEYWVYPGKENKPKNADKIEGACYW
jgi:hypothetical protein